MQQGLIAKVSRYRFTSFAIILAAILVGGGWLWSAVAFSGVDQRLILHFNNLEGITQNGSSDQLSAVAIFGLILVAMNGFMAFALEERDHFLGKFVAGATLILAALLFIGFAAIINVN